MCPYIPALRLYREDEIEPDKAGGELKLLETTLSTKKEGPIP